MIDLSEYNRMEEIERLVAIIHLELVTLRRNLCRDTTPEDGIENPHATALDSATEAAELLANPTSSKDAETITANGKTEFADSLRGLVEHKNPPYPPYYSARHNDIDIRENQSLTCLTLSQIDNEYGEEQLIHICDAPVFLEKLSAFQEMRAQLPKYEGQ